MYKIQYLKVETWHEFLKDRERWLHGAPALWVLPEKEDIQEFQKTVPRTSSIITTIPQLIDTYVREEKEETLLSIHHLESILSELISESDVPYLQIEKYRQGYIKALTDFLYQYQSTSISSLSTAISQFKPYGLTSKERDLISIYQEYERVLPEHGYDLKRGLKALKRESGEVFSSSLGLEPERRVIFYGFNYLTPLREAFILLMAEHKDNVILISCEDGEAAEQSLCIQKSVEDVLKRVPHEIETMRTTHREDFFISLSNSLFHRVKDQKEELERGMKEERLIVHRENNRTTEMMTIARQIKSLLYKGVSLKDIRIIAPSITLYSSIIEEVFTEYHIPFFLVNGVPLCNYPLGALFYNLLNQGLLSNPYPIWEKIFLSPYISYREEISTRDLLKYQESIGVELLSREEMEDFFTPSTYELNYSYLKTIRDKAYRKIKPKDMVQQEVVKAYMDELYRDNHKKRVQESLTSLISFYLIGKAEKKFSLLRPFMEGEEFKESFYYFCQLFHIEENIEIPFKTKRDKKIVRRDRAIYYRVKDLVEELSHILKRRHSYLERTRVFLRLLTETNLIDHTVEQNKAIEVQPVLSSQYRSFDYTFLCGLVDGEFPEEESFNFLTPKKEGLGLGHTYTSVDHGRNTLYHILRSTREALYLSQPLSHNGRMLPGSPFLSEIETLFEAGRLHREELEGDRLYSRREELLSIGSNVDDSYEDVKPLLKKMYLQDREYGENILEILRYDGLVANPTSLSEYEGLFLQSDYSLDLLKEELDTISFNPTILECYASCPLRFYFDLLLNMKEGPDFHPDTTEAGLFIRSLLKEYTGRICKEGGTPEDLEVLFEEEILNYFEKMYGGEEDAFQNRLKNQLLGGLKDISQEGRPGLFRSFLDYEKDPPHRLKPYLAQLSGSLKLGPGFTVHVTIDRVDRTLSGEHVLLYLYTTTNPPHPKKVIRGLSLALPLAILWLTSYMEERGIGIPVSGGGYYMVKGAKSIKRRDYFAREKLQAKRQNSISHSTPIFSGQRQGFLPDEEYWQALEILQCYIKRLYEHMERGVFHLPLSGADDKSCFNCTFQRLCRYDPLLLERLRFNLMNEEEIHVIKELF